MKKYLLAIDQGTTSNRIILFDLAGNQLYSDSREHPQIFPQPGWVEHDAEVIWQDIAALLEKFAENSEFAVADIAAVGITNQRETTVLWDTATGKPVGNAIVWQDTRTAEFMAGLEASGAADHFPTVTGLPSSSYFSASKIHWLLQHNPEASRLAAAGTLAFGTTDSWLLWNLTGGVKTGIHATDVSNASRTLLMNLTTLDWDPQQLDLFNVPQAILPEIRPSSGDFGTITSPKAFAGVPISGILGDQQAATFGQAVVSPGSAKSTYGTGNFILANTGETPVFSQAGLITTVAYQIAGQAAHYALEGSVAVTGSLLHWLRDNLGILRDWSEIDELAVSVDDNGGVYFVPAFSGLFAPHWRPDARGTIVGLTRFANRAHILRAALEAAAFQTMEVVDAMNRDLAEPIRELRVDGGMSQNSLLLQFQADLLNIPVIRPTIIETTALGAAYAAGIGAGIWADPADFHKQWQEDARWLPQMSDSERSQSIKLWEKAVQKSLGWVESS